VRQAGCRRFLRLRATAAARLTLVARRSMALLTALCGRRNAFLAQPVRRSAFCAERAARGAPCWMPSSTPRFCEACCIKTDMRRASDQD